MLNKKLSTIKNYYKINKIIIWLLILTLILVFISNNYLLQRAGIVVSALGIAKTFIRKPYSKPEIKAHVSSNSKKQLCINFTTNNLNSLVNLKLKKTMVINQKGENSEITDSAIKYFLDEINQEIEMNSNYKKITLNKYNFAQAESDYIFRWGIKIEAFILIFEINYDDELRVKIPKEVFEQ